LRIGYPCVNLSVGCTSSNTFMLKSYAEDRLMSTVKSNLECLENILKFNLERLILHFRITSDLVPFGGHPLCTADWRSHFQYELRAIGEFAKSNRMRLSMHPGQYTLINSPQERIFENALMDLEYHESVLSGMGLDTDAKIQIHVGGVYGDKPAAISRFVDRFSTMSSHLTRRIVIENDERSYSVEDCLKISGKTGTPVVVDSLHHRANSGGLSLKHSMRSACSTWRREDGIPIVDYSSQQAGKRLGSHALSIDKKDFRSFLNVTKEHDFDLMLEIKDKERSALEALKIASADARLVRTP